MKRERREVRQDKRTERRKVIRVRMKTRRHATCLAVDLSRCRREVRHEERRVEWDRGTCCSTHRNTAPFLSVLDQHLPPELTAKWPMILHTPEICERRAVVEGGEGCQYGGRERGTGCLRGLTGSSVSREGGGTARK